MSNSDDKRLVYSTDPKDQKKPKQKKEEKVQPKGHCIKLRLESKSRGGKSVSVLYDLPQNKDYLKALLKELKGHCACGGSLKEKPYTLEIQGDQRLKIKGFLEKKGFQVKGA